MRLDIVFNTREIDNLNPLTKFTGSSRNTEFKDIVPWNICQMVPISTRIVESYAMKKGMPF